MIFVCHEVNDDGNVAIVHEPSLLDDHPTISYSIDLRVHPDNTNYFKVHWKDGNYPNTSNSCGEGACMSVYKGCYCDVNIDERTVFDSLPSGESAILSQLHIGAFDPELLDSYTKALDMGGLEVWHKSGGYNKDTIFCVTYRGSRVCLRNMESTIKISGATEYSYRNPPSFVNIAQREPRDAMYETDAVLENYFYHSNVAPFLALRIIQRFGISNPSPRYIETVATGECRYFTLLIYGHL